VNFHNFRNIRKDININKRFLILKIFLHDKSLYFFLGLVAKILKYFNKFVPPYMANNQNMVKLFYG
jgi:hypothetical protein